MDTPEPGFYFRAMDPRGENAEPFRPIGQAVLEDLVVMLPNGARISMRLDEGQLHLYSPDGTLLIRPYSSNTAFVSVETGWEQAALRRP